MAISKKGTYFAKLNLKSKNGSILGEREIILNSKSEFSENWARFYTFEIDKGTKIIPGYYEYTLKLVPNDSKEGLNKFISMIAPFLADPKMEENFSGTILFSPDSKEIFQKKLVEYKSNLKAAIEKPIKEKMEKWEAYQSIVGKVEVMLQDEINKIKKGPEIIQFEKKYTEFLGPMLSQIVIESKKLSQELATSSQEKSLEYEKLFLFGKEIGETTSNLVLEIKKIKKFGDKDKATFLNKLYVSFETLQKNITTELYKIQNELDLISF